MGRKIELKRVKMEFEDEAGRKMPSVDFSYKETLIGLLQNSLNSQGLSFEDIEAALKVLPDLRKAEEPGALVLEDEHWRTIKDKLPQLRFQRPHEEILIFKKAVLEAELVKMKEA